MTQIKRILVGFYLFLFLAILSACDNANKNADQTNNTDTLLSGERGNKPEPIAIPLKKDSFSLWIYDYNTSIPVKNKEAKSDILTPQKLIGFINSNNPKVHLDFIKISTDTIFVKIKESTALTQQMGTTGADEYMSVTTFTLTELKGIKYVNYNFEEGDHANPGTYSRKEYLERNK